jgi:integrase
MAKKHRGHNEGSIHQRENGHWRAQLYQAGKRYSKDFQTKAEVQTWIRSIQANIDHGFQLQGSSMTLAEYLPGWLDNRRLSLRAKTAHQYSRTIQNHILPALGKSKLRDLRLLDIERFYSQLLQKGMGARTIRVIHNILHSALDKAVRYGLVTYNPTSGATLPKYSHDEMMVLDADQVTQFLITAQDSPNYALFHLAITTGMRIGELFGLKWSDVLWQSGVVHVQRQKQYVPGQGVQFVDPKTKAGRRTIKLGEGSLEVLRHHKAFQETQKARAGDRWHNLDLVFPNSLGGPGDASNIRLDFNWILKTAGLPKVRIHDLRHSCASLLLNHKVPVIVVSKMLGHSKPSVTLDIYAHVFHDMQDEAAVVMDKLVTPILVEIPRVKQQTFNLKKS